MGSRCQPSPGLVARAGGKKGKNSGMEVWSCGRGEGEGRMGAMKRKRAEGIENHAGLRSGGRA